MKPWVIPVIACPLLLSGCATYTDLQNTEVTAQQNYALMKEDYQRIKGQIDLLQADIDQLHQQVDRLRNAPNSQIQALQSTLDQLSQRLAAEESARQRDKQEMIDTLSTKMAKLLASTPRSAPSTPSRKVSNSGFEHKVEAGQTLNAIAAAYKVKPADIMQANNITDPTKIRAGQTLFIPSP